MLFVPGPSPAYFFSKPLNRLDFGPTYPKNPETFRNYIRKWRMDKEISQVELAKTLRLKVPKTREIRKRIVREIEVAGSFLWEARLH